MHRSSSSLRVGWLQVGCASSRPLRQYSLARALLRRISRCDPCAKTEEAIAGMPRCLRPAINAIHSLVACADTSLFYIWLAIEAASISLLSFWKFEGSSRAPKLLNIACHASTGICISPAPARDGSAHRRAADVPSVRV
ncbi:hypothetical protein BV25DRAFT_1831001 [Artomyces pyxidatus]|uniref:Uncharacterized protein n=1 Tax=Artomyces pyxidatus TaxID=48021 RepID=A0ACB8SPB7_9AGAM|nr:hypothetical protein BV25DRAFT_1831001 [Artomyces pyxidatus]